MAEYKKSRTPYQLKDNDYDNFLLGLEKYAVDHGADPDFYPHWAILEPLIAAYHTAFQALVAAKQLIKDTKRDFDAAVKDLQENMTQLKRQLPVLIRDEGILGHFALEDEVPDDVDLLKVNARICRDYWDSLCDPAPPAEYAQLVDKLDAMASLITAVEDTQRAYADAIRVREDARIVKDEARDACNKEEREMFTWYRGIWTDPEDTHWSATQWPRATGEGEGGTKWDAKPIAYIKVVTFPKDGVAAGVEKYSGTKRFDFRIASAKKNLPIPDMPLVDYAADVEEPVFLDVELVKGFMYYAWVRARKGSEVSPWSEVAGVEWEKEGEEPEPIEP